VYRTALDLANAAIAANPYPVSYSERGAIYYALHQYEESIDDFTAAIRRQPNNGDFYSQRAVVYEAMNEIEKADADRARAQQAAAGERVDADTAGDTADDDDDDGSWGVKGSGTIQKMH
jgi:tetratricopeptide (TPR) repeat protein